MARTRYVALLRGVNVGGKNPVAMAALREAVEADGHGDVRTYIQSGNVLFTSDVPRRDLEERLEAAIEQRFRLSVIVVVRSLQQLRKVVDDRPRGFGSRSDTFHSDAIFLKAPVTSAKAMRMIERVGARREGVDEAHPGNGVVYFSRLSAERTKSRMGKIVGTPEYASMTIRSWSTTTKLLELLAP
jgi:uncharacterized protein (DUF1697 family)